MKHYQHLGVYSDLVVAADKQRPLYPLARPGRETQQRIRDVMGFCTFKPDTHYPVRWIDVEQDYDLVRAFWPSDLSQDEWHSFKGMGYTYAAVAAGSPHAARIGLMSLCGALPKV